MWRTVLIICLTLTVFGCNGDDNPVQPTPTSFKVRIENASAVFDFLTSGVFNMPVGAASPGPIGPGGAYEFTFDAGLGSRLSFVSMFVPSNDLFFAPDENGIALFNGDRTPVNGDVTSQIELWDAGTEENQEPGVGQDQVQRQSGPNTGASDSNNSVRLVNDGFSYPSVSDVIKVTITANSETNFTVRIENVSTGTTLQPSDGSMQAVPLSPGVWVVHTEAEPLFTSGQSDRDEGLEAIAEDGNPSSLGGVLSAETGLTVPLSPGVWAVHTTSAPLFTPGQPDRGDGLEAIAEDGNPSSLVAALPNQSGVEMSGVFNTPVGASSPAPIGPGGAYEFTFTANSGDRLSFATMFVPSNDLFFAPDENGVALFDSDGTPISGEVTAQIMLWDAGTEVNQKPGVGSEQVQRQTGPDTGANENGVVQLVNDTFTYPNVSDVIRVTITQE